MTEPHILIIRFSALGDVAMLVPVVHSLAVQYPHARITVVSRPFAAAFFSTLDSNVSFKAVDLKQYKGLGGLSRLYSQLRALAPTHIADCHGVMRTLYLRLRFRLGGSCKVACIDKHRKEKRGLTATKGKKMCQLPTSFSNYADVLAALGFPVKLSFESLYESRKAPVELLPENLSVKPQGEKWIGLAPFATHPGKIYPIKKMERVVELLLERNPKSRIFLFHGRGAEAEQMTLWEKRFSGVTEAEPLPKDRRVQSASSQLGGIDKELVLMSELDVMVSMDSSNMHLASLVSCPVVSVWGATHRFAGFLGWNQDPQNCVQLEGLECRPCSVYGNRPCVHGDYRCLESITPEAVVEKIERNL